MEIGGVMDSDDINGVCFAKGEERYIVLFAEDRRADALRTIGRWAADADLSFSWYDAAVLSQKIGETECIGR